MKLHKYLVRNGIKYEFVSKCNDDFFLYKNVKTGVKASFTRFQLGLINNVEIDKIVLETEEKDYKVIVYDKLFDTETEYDTVEQAAQALGMGHKHLSDKIRYKEWYQNRWFVSREYKEE